MPTLQDLIDIMQELGIKPSDIKMGNKEMETAIKEIAEYRVKHGKKHPKNISKKTLNPAQVPAVNDVVAEEPKTNPFKRLLRG
jgi:hypothetical protein